MVKKLKGGGKNFVLHDFKKIKLMEKVTLKNIFEFIKYIYYLLHFQKIIQSIICFEKQNIHVSIIVFDNNGYPDENVTIKVDTLFNCSSRM